MSDLHPLTFGALRVANTLRLPQFKNKAGELAHARADGSDWSPAEWFCAVLGELGEAARVRLDFEQGTTYMDDASFVADMGRELADVQTYLDILAKRALDRLVTYRAGGNVVQGCPFADSPAKTLLRILAAFGEYANALKKARRGDVTGDELDAELERFRSAMQFNLADLARTSTKGLPHPDDEVEAPHPTGVDLGRATEEKFNEVSRRVGAPVWLQGAVVSVDE